MSMQKMGQMKQTSKAETEKRLEGEGGLCPQERWAWWVERKVKMRSFSEKQHLLTYLKWIREAELHG